MDNLELLKPAEVSKLLKVPLPRAYKIIHSLNSELEKKGYYTVRCRISKAYLIQRINGTNVS